MFLFGRVQRWGRGSAGREAVPGSYQPLRANTGERDNPWVKGIVSRDGGVAVLAGRRCLALINLSDPTQVIERQSLG